MKAVGTILGAPRGHKMRALPVALRLAVLAWCTPLSALAPQAADSAGQTYYGLSVGVIYGDPTRIALVPFAGLRVAPQVSLGAKLNVEALFFNALDHSTFNYGAGIFTRFHPSPLVYGQVEFDYTSIALPVAGAEERRWVPFLLVGGGVLRPVGERTAAYLEILVDVLGDPWSPYGAGQPFISVGVGVGI